MKASRPAQIERLEVAIRTAQPAVSFSELDIPAEWRNDLFRSYGEVIEPFSDEESEAVELDRR